VQARFEASTFAGRNGVEENRAGNQAEARQDSAFSSAGMLEAGVAEAGWSAKMLTDLGM
jgi:hypothetical protein